MFSVFEYISHKTRKWKILAQGVQNRVPSDGFHTGEMFKIVTSNRLNVSNLCKDVSVLLGELHERKRVRGTKHFESLLNAGVMEERVV